MKILVDDRVSVDQVRFERTTITGRELLIFDSETPKLSTLIKKLQQIQEEIGDGTFYVHDEDDRGTVLHVSVKKKTKLTKAEVDEIKARLIERSEADRRNRDIFARVRARSLAAQKGASDE